MIRAKEQVERILHDLPDDCSVEDVQYRLYVVETIRQRLEQADRETPVSQDDVEKHFAKWLKK